MEGNDTEVVIEVEDSNETEVRAATLANPFLSLNRSSKAALRGHGQHGPLPVHQEGSIS